MIGRTALALLIESKRDEEDPRVLPFYWGDDSGWARQSFAPAPQPGRLSLPSVRSNALAMGSFASQGPPSSYGETSARLLAKKKSGSKCDGCDCGECSGCDAYANYYKKKQAGFTAPCTH